MCVDIKLMECPRASINFKAVYPPSLGILELDTKTCASKSVHLLSASHCHCGLKFFCYCHFIEQIFFLTGIVERMCRTAKHNDSTELQRYSPFFHELRHPVCLMLLWLLSSLCMGPMLLTLLFLCYILDWSVKVMMWTRDILWDGLHFM